MCTDKVGAIRKEAHTFFFNWIGNWSENNVFLCSSCIVDNGNWSQNVVFVCRAYVDIGHER